jgi:hypothetical protein
LLDQFGRRLRCALKRCFDRPGRDRQGADALCCEFARPDEQCANFINALAVKTQVGDQITPALRSNGNSGL